MQRRPIPGVFVVALVLIVPGLVVMGLQIYQVRARTPQLTQNRELVVHTFEVITTAQALATAVRDAERGQRHYLVTGDSKYLEIYQRAAPMHLRFWAIPWIRKDYPRHHGESSAAKSS
jgi:CHASE3 domain sensor protein